MKWLPRISLAGAWLLKSAWDYFPPGTIHLSVVDPGVGTRRRALAASCDGRFLVGPDNGLFSLIFAEHAPHLLIDLQNPRYFLPNVSATFHGRDIFAPVAAHLSLGVPLTAMGPALADPVRLTWPDPEFGPAQVAGKVVACDHFGNLISNIPVARLADWLQGRPAEIQLQGQDIPHLAGAYGDVPVGALLALGGSHGCLEIACRQGSAKTALGAGVGDRITINVENCP